MIFQGTHVLRDFQKKKKERQKHLEKLKIASTAESKSQVGGLESGSRIGEDAAREGEDAAAADGARRPGSQYPRGKLPRKLTFGQSENALFVDESEDDDQEEHKGAEEDDVAMPMGHATESAPMLGRAAASRVGGPAGGALAHSASVAATRVPIESQDNLLHLDLTKTLDAQQQQQPRSAPPPGSGLAGPQGPSSVASSNSKSSFHFTAAERYVKHPFF